MTVKVIKKAPHKSVVKEKVCKKCGATLQYVPKDVAERTMVEERIHIVSLSVLTVQKKWK